jgi:OmpA-OmpF porin, OOP family
MKRHFHFLLLAVLFSFLTPAITKAQPDKEGCKDYPLFTRMPNTYIYECKYVEFDAREWPDPGTMGKTRVNVEGKYWFIHYYSQKGFEDKRSDLQISRNYSNAIRSLGGSVYESRGTDTFMKLSKDGKEIWVYVSSYRGDQIKIEIIEKEAMKQEIVSDAKFMVDSISSSGHVAIYGIYFDIDKADIKPESEPTLAEMGKLLKTNPTLKVLIVGHTDSAGTFEHNMKLSQDRAASVVNALVSKHGIPIARLKGVGAGSIAPVASNKTEEGRAKNRRVELVEQ